MALRPVWVMRVVVVLVVVVVGSAVVVVVRMKRPPVLNSLEVEMSSWIWVMVRVLEVVV